MQKVNLFQVDSDEELVRKIRRGDREAERVLILRLYPGVYTLAVRMLRQPETARDATQDAFFKAFRRLHQYDGVHRFSAWVFRILINLIRDGVRRGGRVVIAELRPDDWPSHQPIPVDAAIRAESAERVRREVENLPESLRAAVLLHFQEGFNQREVGYALGISHDAARLKISRAMAKLRERMGGGE